MAPSTDFHRKAPTAPALSGGFATSTSNSAFLEIGAEGKLERVVIPVEKQDVWDDLKLCGQDRPVFAWSDPAGDLEFVATGEVDRVEVTGAERFDQAEQWCSGVFEQLGANAPELPCVVGGFAFSTSSLRYGSWWKNWPDGCFVLPERIAYRRRLVDGTIEAGIIVHRRRRGYGDEALDPGEFQRALLRGGDEPRAQADLKPCAQAEVSPEGFEALVGEALESIGRGELTKVVVARAAKLNPPEGSHVHLQETIRRICEGGDPTIGFALTHPRGGTFVGRTPEVLLRVEQGRFFTHAMAGTIGRGRTPSEDEVLGQELLSSAKDRLEHDLVIQGMAAALQPICDELRLTEQPELVRLETVQHLSTGISGKLRGRCSLLHAVANLHPTPALCGSPKGSSRRWIADHESLDRGWYAAPVGWIAPDGAGTFAVAIRSALLRDSEALAFGGAGIVEGSEPAKEWRETEMKIDAVGRHILTREVG